MRGPERKGEAFICRYSWIPHQVRNDETAGSRKVPLVGIAFARISRPGIPGFRIKYGMTGRVFLDSASHRVTPHSDAGSICRYFWIPHHTGSPCTAMRGPLAGISFASIPGFRIKCGMTERVFPGFRVAPGHPAPDAGSRKVPLVGIAFADISRPGISGFRIKCGMTGSPGGRREPFHSATTTTRLLGRSGI